MRRYFILASIVVCYLLLSHEDALAQNPPAWGIRVGGNSTALHPNFEYEVPIFESRLGMNIALLRQFKFVGPFSIQVELEYAQRGVIHKTWYMQDGQLPQAVRAKTSIGYLSIPVLLILSTPLSREHILFLSLGPRIDAIICRNHGVWEYEDSTQQDLLASDFTDAGLGISVGFGFQMNTAFHNGIRFEFRHTFGITDIRPMEYSWHRPVTMKSFELSATLFF